MLRIKNRFLRWAVYGYGFGFVGWLILLTVFAVKDGAAFQSADWDVAADLKWWALGLVWAVPWAVAGCFCGLASIITGDLITAISAIIGVIGGVALDLSECSLIDGWLVMTVPFYAIPAMLGAVFVTAACFARFRLRPV
jgi:hypothetical protein